jgi:hypothetical protein
MLFYLPKMKFGFSEAHGGLVQGSLRRLGDIADVGACRVRQGVASAQRRFEIVAGQP